MKKASSSKASPVQNLPLSVVLVLQEYRTFCACSLLALEVAVHTLLYTRHIYPSDAFIPRTKWGVTVQMMRFPMVIDYVGAALEASMAQIAHGALGANPRITLVLLASQGYPVERWLFDLEDLLGGLTELQVKNQTLPVQNAPTVEALHTKFQEAIVQLIARAGARSRLDLTDDATFSILVETPEAEPAPNAEGLYKDFTPAPEAYTTQGVRTRRRNGEDVGRTGWIQAVDTGVIDLSMAVQEISPPSTT